MSPTLHHFFTLSWNPSWIRLFGLSLSLSDTHIPFLQSNMNGELIVHHYPQALATLLLLLIYLFLHHLVGCRRDLLLVVLVVGKKIKCSKELYSCIVNMFACSWKSDGWIMVFSWRCVRMGFLQMQFYTLNTGSIRMAYMNLTRQTKHNSNRLCESNLLSGGNEEASSQCLTYYHINASIASIIPVHWSQENEPW